VPTVNINVTKDKYYDRSTLNVHGTDTTIYIGGMVTFSATYMRYQSNISAPLADVPANKKITSALLYFYVNTISGTGTKKLYAWQIANFVETSDGIATSYGTIPETDISLDTQGKWYSIDITDFAQAHYVKGNDDCSIFLSAIPKPPDEAIGYDVPTYVLSSREGSNVPYMAITYEDLPPNPPTNLSPTSETKLNNEVIRFSWTHNGTQTGDTQSKFDLLWSSNGGETWNTVTQSTANQYYDMPADTLPVGSIIWKVRTYATSGLVSEYSDQAAFTSAGEPDAPVLTKPDAIENTSTPLIAWTGTGQVMYQAQILQGETVVWDSGEIASTTGQAQVGTALADGASYTAKVRIKNQYDLWSDWASKAFTVDFEVPNKPVIDIIKDLVRFSSRITISNPTPDSAGGFEYNEVYRREVGGSWMRIATEIERDITYEDCAMKSGQPYEYKVRAVGTYGYMDSDVKFSEVKVKDSQLASLTDKSLYVPLRYDPKRTISIGAERALMKFAGRTQAVTEFGEHIDKGIALQFVVESLENVDKLIELVESTETLLFRDGKGRKIYCTVGNLDIEELENYWTVSFAIAETSHQEAV